MWEQFLNDLLISCSLVKIKLVWVFFNHVIVVKFKILWNRLVWFEVDFNTLGNISVLIFKTSRFFRTVLQIILGIATKTSTVWVVICNLYNHHRAVQISFEGVKYSRSFHLLCVERQTADLIVKFLIEIKLHTTELVFLMFFRDTFLQLCAH